MNGGIGVVSVLEGGYSLSAPKQSAKDKKASQNLPTSSLVSTRGGGRGSNTVLATDTSKVADLTRKYAQLPGDGGLVKRFQHFFFLPVYVIVLYVLQCFGTYGSVGWIRGVDFVKDNIFEN